MIMSCAVRGVTKVGQHWRRGKLPADNERLIVLVMMGTRIVCCLLVMGNGYALVDWGFEISV